MPGHRTRYSQFIQICVCLVILLKTVHPMWHLIVIRYASRPLTSPILLTSLTDMVCYKHNIKHSHGLSLPHTALRLQDSSEKWKAWNCRTGVSAVNKHDPLPAPLGDILLVLPFAGIMAIPVDPHVTLAVKMHSKNSLWRGSLSPRAKPWLSAWNLASFVIKQWNI